MAAVTSDFFAKCRFPAMLKTWREEKAAFILRGADIENNKYTSDLWMFDELQGPVQLTFSGDVTKFWWTLDGKLVFPRFDSEQQKQDAEAGLPSTMLKCIDISLPGEAKPWINLDFEVTDLLDIGGGKFVFTAAWDPSTQKILDTAGQDKSRAKKLLQENNSYTVLEEYPFWDNGGGFRTGVRDRMWLWDGEIAVALTDEYTDVEFMRASPSAENIFFVSRSYIREDSLKNNLFVLDVSTMEIEDISRAASFCHNTVVPVDEDTLLVFGSDMEKYGIGQNGDFLRLEVSSRQWQTLYEGGMYNGWDALVSDLKMPSPAVWPACGQSVYFISTLGDSTHLLSIDVDTGEIARQTDTSGAVCEVVVLGGRPVYTAVRTGFAPELYMLMPDGENQLSDFNIQTAETPISQPVSLNYTNNEGNVIQGWVIQPQGFSPDHSYPAVLCIHGGPKAAYGTAAFHEMQYLAHAGFGVIFCNPTGSDGRGDEFADIRGRYGLVDFDDIMGFTTKALEQHDWIDPARLGVMGGSYGGFMVNWIIGQTGMFRAAISQRGISNWITMATMSDIGLWYVNDQICADPLDDPDTLWEASPLKYAAGVSTPTLFMHSDKDYRCPVAESMQMYSALQSRGVDTKMVIFHDENHELSRSGKPKNRVRRLEEILAWFEKYLA